MKTTNKKILSAILASTVALTSVVAFADDEENAAAESLLKITVSWDEAESDGYAIGMYGYGLLGNKYVDFENGVAVADWLEEEVTEPQYLGWGLFQKNASDGYDWVADIEIVDEDGETIAFADLDESEYTYELSNLDTTNKKITATAVTADDEGDNTTSDDESSTTSDDESSTTSDDESSTTSDDTSSDTSSDDTSSDESSDTSDDGDTSDVEGGVLLGDVNNDGSINARDVSRLLGHIARLNTLEGDALAAADVNQDGSVNARDVSSLLNLIADIEGDGDDTSEPDDTSSDTSDDGSSSDTSDDGSSSDTSDDGSSSDTSSDDSSSSGASETSGDESTPSGDDTSGGTSEPGTTTTYAVSVDEDIDKTNYTVAVSDPADGKVTVTITAVEGKVVTAATLTVDTTDEEFTVANGVATLEITLGALSDNLVINNGAGGNLSVTTADAAAPVEETPVLTIKVTTDIDDIAIKYWGWEGTGQERYADFDEEDGGIATVVWTTTATSEYGWGWGVVSADDHDDWKDSISGFDFTDAEGEYTAVLSYADGKYTVVATPVEEEPEETTTTVDVSAFDSNELATVNGEVVGDNVVITVKAKDTKEIEKPTSTLGTFGDADAEGTYTLTVALDDLTSKTETDATGNKTITIAAGDITITEKASL